MGGAWLLLIQVVGALALGLFGVWVFLYWPYLLKKLVRALVIRIRRDKNRADTDRWLKDVFGIEPDTGGRVRPLSWIHWDTESQDSADDRTENATWTIVPRPEVPEPDEPTMRDRLW
jgi:hypothetical protein